MILLHQRNITSGLVLNLVLNKEIIQRLLRREFMKEFLNYREIELEGKLKVLVKLLPICCDRKLI
jgi:hypothetical protein